jgi:hypothetical protein
MKTRFIAAFMAVMFPLFSRGAGITQASFDANFGYTGTAQQPLMHIVSGADFTNLTLTGTTTATGPIVGTGSGPGSFSFTNTSTGNAVIYTNDALQFISNAIVTASISDSGAATFATVAGSGSNILAGTGITVTPSGGNATVAVSAYVNTNNASQLSSGTVADARLSTAVVETNGANNGGTAQTMYVSLNNTNAIAVSGINLNTNGVLYVKGATNTTPLNVIVPRTGSTTAEIHAVSEPSLQFVYTWLWNAGTSGTTGEAGIRDDGVMFANGGYCVNNGNSTVISSGGNIQTGSYVIINYTTSGVTLPIGATSVNGISSVGNTLEQVVGSYVNTNVTGNVAGTLLFTNSTANTIRGTVHYNASVLVAAAAGTFTIAITGTNDFGQAYTITPFSALSTAATGPLDLTLTVPDSFNFTLGASKSLTMTATIGGTGSPTVDLGIWTDRALNQ